MSSVSGNFGNATTPRPVADAWCVFELDSGNTPVLIDGHGVSGVSRVQGGVYRVAFNNPQRFASGAYVALTNTELGNLAGGYGLTQVHGSTAHAGVTAGGASASCDICFIGFNAGSSAAPTSLVDVANTNKGRINAAFFCLRADADLRKTRIANYAPSADNLAFFSPPSGSSGGVVKVPNAAIAPDGSNTAVGVLVTPNSLGVRKVVQFYNQSYQRYVNNTVDSPVGKDWNGSIYIKAGEPNRVLAGASANVYFIDNAGPNWGFLKLNLDTGVSTLDDTNSLYSSHSVEPVGNGWYRVSISHKSGPRVSDGTYGGAWNFYIGMTDQNAAGSDYETAWSGNGSIEMYVWGPQMEEGTRATPFIPNTGAVLDSATPVLGNQDLLIDPYPGTNGFGVGSRQNLFKYSQTFTNAYWTKTNMGVSAGGYTAPDGTTTAMKIFELDPSASTPANGQYYKTIYTNSNNHPELAPLLNTGLTAGKNVTVSVFAKAAERQHLVITDPTCGVIGNLVVDLTTGAVTQNSRSLGVRTIPCGNGWWRVATTFRTIASLPSTPENSVGFGTAAGATVEGPYGSQYPGVSGSGILLWGAQCEQGTVFGEYTPTGASVAGTTYSRLAGNTYSSLLPALGNRGEATAWGTIVVPPNQGNVSPVSAYLENSYGVSSVSASSNSRFEVFFTKPMHTNQYCVVTATEQEPVHIPEATSGSGSIPPTEEFTLNMIQDTNATAESKTVNRFIVTQLRQASTNAFTQQSIHYQRGRTTRIHFMVFGGRQLYGTP